MTCLAVLKGRDGALHFAGDRRISWDMSKSQVAPRPKVTYRNGVLFAGTGTAYICDLVTDLFDIPDYGNTDTFHYIHATFIPKFLKWLRVEGWVAEGERRLKATNQVDKDEDTQGAIILVGVFSDLYELSIDENQISADAINTPYAAGCGGSLALGSLLTTERFKMGVNERLHLAINVAAESSPGCDDNIDIVTNKDLF